MVKDEELLRIFDFADVDKNGKLDEKEINDVKNSENVIVKKYKTDDRITIVKYDTNIPNEVKSVSTMDLKTGRSTVTNFVNNKRFTTAIEENRGNDRVITFYYKEDFTHPTKEVFNKGLPGREYTLDYTYNEDGSKNIKKDDGVNISYFYYDPDGKLIKKKENAIKRASIDGKDSPYNIENMKKDYPEKDYLFKTNEMGYDIIDKTTNKKVKNIYCEDENVFINLYDENGKLAISTKEKDGKIISRRTYNPENGEELVYEDYSDGWLSHITLSDSNGNITCAINYKENGKMEKFTAYKSADANYYSTFIYDNEENLLSTGGSSGRKVKTPIVDDIYNDIKHNREVWIFPGAKEFDSHIKKITKNNAIDVLREYNAKGSNLFTDILDDRKLNNNEKIEYVSYLSSVLKDAAYQNNLDIDDVIDNINNDIKSSRSLNNERIISDLGKIILRRSLNDDDAKMTKPNGKLDGDFKQGSTGDCWLLSAIKSISLCDDGKKALENMISVDEKTGDTTVFLKGADKSYTFTQKELKAATHLSGGDGDIRAIELAVEAYFRDENGKGEYPIDLNGNFPYKAYQILLGNPKNIEIEENAVTDTIINSFNDTKLVRVASCHFNEGKAVDDENKEVEIIQAHAYTIKGCNDKYVYLINPWDSAATLRITREEFKETFELVETYKL